MFYGATRVQQGKVINNDAFLALPNTALIMDGSGEALGAAKTALEVMKKSSDFVNPDWGKISRLAHTILLGYNRQSTFLGVNFAGGSIHYYVLGDTTLHVYSDGMLKTLSNRNSMRLGREAQILGGNVSSYAVKRYDVVLMVSDGFTLDKYRTVQAIQKNMIRPQDLPQALLEANKDRSDDVTVVTSVIK